MYPSPTSALRPTTIGLALLLAACAVEEETEVNALQVDGVWVFSYSVTPDASMHALGGGQATVVDGCLQVGDAVVVWHDHHLDTVEEVIARVNQGETIELGVGGGGLSLEEGSTTDDFPAAVVEHCAPLGVWFSSDEAVVIE